MPLYEYACRDCSLKFEQLVFATTVPACPECHGKDLEKLLSVFAVGGGGPGRGASGPDRDASGPGGSCGSCGDPRGPGSCDTN